MAERRKKNLFLGVGGPFFLSYNMALWPLHSSIPLEEGVKPSTLSPVVFAG